MKKKIKKLIDLIENTEIEEIEVSSFWGAQKIKLSRSKNSGNIANPEIVQKNQDKSINLDEKSNTSHEVENVIEDTIVEPNKIDDLVSTDDIYEDESKFKIIRAPLVGTFYSSSKPEDPAFISIGDNITIGMVVCIIEAMKIFNEIDAETDGELVHIYVENGTPDEYGQELFVLRIDDV